MSTKKSLSPGKIFIKHLFLARLCPGHPRSAPPAGCNAFGVSLCSNRFPPATRPTPKRQSPFFPSRQTETETSPPPIACTSIQNADCPATSAHLVRLTHPFHPLSGQSLVCVGERYNRYGRRLLLRVDDKTVCSAPREWTDLAVPDPEVVLGQGRALFRVADLVDLARLLARLRQRDSREVPNEV